MTISQKRAIWYSYRDIKFRKFIQFINSNKLVKKYFIFRCEHRYVYYMNYVRYFCKQENIFYNLRSKKYEKRT